MCLKQQQQDMLIQKDLLGKCTIRKEKCQRQLYSLVCLFSSFDGLGLDLVKN